VPWLTAKAFAALHERAARAEAAASTAEGRADMADARFDALFREYATLRQKGADPTPTGQPPSAAAPLPDMVVAELQEFGNDPELYAHNRRYAESELAKGTEPVLVAQAIRFGQQGTPAEDE
jgi:hypothetical protein